MPIVEIKCPRCGSGRASKVVGNQYHCDHCGTNFAFVDTSLKKVVIERHDRRYCPICGKPVGKNEGVRCVECGKEDICEDCRSGDCSDNKARCQSCYQEWCKREGQICSVCGECTDDWRYHCIVCGRWACDNHFVSLFCDSDWYELWCTNCVGGICNDCRRKVITTPLVKTEDVDFDRGGEGNYCPVCKTKNLHYEEEMK